MLSSRPLGRPPRRAVARSVPVLGLLAGSALWLATPAAHAVAAQDPNGPGSRAAAGAAPAFAVPGQDASTSDQALVIAPHRDLTFALREFLENPERKAREKSFEKLILEIPSCLRERLYETASEEVRCLVRQVALQPVRRHAEFREFLRTFALEAPPHYDDLRLLCVEIMADDAAPATLASMLVILSAVGPDAVNYPAMLPPLGRVLATVRPQVEASGAAQGFELLSAAQSVLEDSLFSDSPARRGGAISGLVEAGRADLARETLSQALQESPESELLPQLDAARRALLREDFGPGLREPALQRARDHVRAFLDAGPSGPIGGATGLSPQILRFREAFQLVRVLGQPEDALLLLECFARDGSASLLGLDGLQRSRLFFQYRRDELDDSVKARIDQTLSEILLSTGERLFDIVEDPMDTDERAEYLDARDLRYNCAGYFVGLWKDEEAVRELWCTNSDAPDYLELLVRSDRDEYEGPPDDRYYSKLRDKTETRLYTARLLAMLCRDTGTDPRQLNLEHFFLELVSREMSADPEDAIAAFEEWKGTAAPQVILHLAETRPPPDDFVKLVALHGMTDLGYAHAVLEGGDVLIMRW